MMKRPVIFLNWDRLRRSMPDLGRLLSRPSRFQTGLILLAIILLAYQSAGLFYKTLNLKLVSAGAASRLPQKASATPVAGTEPLDAYRAIPERNLFGSTDRPLRGTAGPSDSIAALEVRGTVAGDARYGFAIIEDKNLKKQKLYRVGDRVGGAEVIRIMRNAVAFRIDNREKILKIPETSETPILPGRGTVGAISPGAAVTAVPGGSITVNKDEINNILKDMGTMLSQAQIRPYFTAGAPDGFIISNIKSGSIYQKIGLSDGDIVQGVNNRSIKTADDMMALYDTLKTGPGMALQIKRQGRPETFNYVFR